VIVGTCEKNKPIGALAAKKRIDISKVRGQWETFLITSVAKPFPGLKNALVIAGSDRRGAAFGAFELSSRIGVSPWVWWADVRPDIQKNINVNIKGAVFGPPSVQYRGIFLNDEDFGLKPWAAKTFEPEVGDIGPKTYAKIFELLLRLKANTIWPAMHKCTKAFNYYDHDKFVADDYAIVMGSSHCEQMLRNNVDEWNFDARGAWTYTGNRDRLLKYWDERVEANGRFENIYTLGMRAIHDDGMPDGKTTPERVSILESIISDQREMLRRRVNSDETKVPQVFIPYKEVLDLYRGGLKVPGDVTIMWPDDNFGYIRRLSGPAERLRSGGSGVYYHISYWGPPHDYLWLETTPPSLIWEEMNKAYANSARKMWIVNVGDIKPNEIGMEFFLRMAWDINKWNAENIGGFLDSWAGREFGAGNAAEVASIMNRYYTLNSQRKPEHMGFYDKYSLNAQNADPEFSLFNYGDEAQRRIDSFDDIERRAEAVFNKLPAPKKDAFFQLVLYPVKASSQMNKKHLYGFKSRVYARQRRASANADALLSEAAQKTIAELTAYYNDTMAGGKWKHMMDDSPNGLAAFGPVKTGNAKLAPEPGLGVAVEGSSKPAAPAGSEGAAVSKLPVFNRFTRKSYFIDIFNTGTGALDWKASPSANWIRLDKSSGSVQDADRIYVSVDFDAAPRGDIAEGSVSIQGADRTYEIAVGAFNPNEEIKTNKTFVQDNGVIAIDAVNYSSKKDIGAAGWKVIPGLGRAGAVIALEPPDMTPLESEADIKSASPYVEYNIYVFEPGDAKLIVYASPSHELHGDESSRLMASFDDGGIIAVKFAQSDKESDTTGKENVFRNMMEGRAAVKLDKGSHTLRIWGADFCVMPERIFIDFGGMKKSYLGPQETRNGF